MKTNPSNSLRQPESRTKTKFEKILLRFLGCLIISFIFWLVIKFTNSYTTTLSFNLRYSNLPSNEVILDKDLNHNKIKIYLKGKGIDLLRYKLYHKNIEIDLSDLKIKRKENKLIYYYLTNTETSLKKISDKLNSRFTIISVKPDTLFFELTIKYQKEIPVKLINNLTFKEQYKLNSGIVLKPKTITVYGPKLILDTINYIYTKPITIENIDKTISREVELIKPNNPDIVLSENKVKAIILVSKFTEITIEKLPIKILNMPANHSMKIFPSTIKLTYQLRADDYIKITSNMFEATIDYNEIKNSNTEKLKVNISKKPSFINNITVVPDKVEYLILK